MSMLVKIDDKVFEDALKRHEEAFEKELAEIDIREVVLKTKKSVIEQARQNNSVYEAVLDHNHTMSNLKAKVERLSALINSFEDKVSDLEEQLKKSNETYVQTMNVLIKMQQEKQVSPIRKFWEFIKCLVK
jgi:lipid II:glycine glycyltransferase (peptidoglycan interpeptide bridge formation enzyme)